MPNLYAGPTEESKEYVRQISDSSEKKLSVIRFKKDGEGPDLETLEKKINDEGYGNLSKEETYWWLARNYERGIEERERSENASKMSKIPLSENATVGEYLTYLEQAIMSYIRDENGNVKKGLKPEEYYEALKVLSEIAESRVMLKNDLDDSLLLSWNENEFKQ